MGVRRLYALLSGLPLGSPVHRAIDPEGWNWDQKCELMAAQVEFTDLGNKMFAAVNAKDGDGRVEDPIQIPRPGKESKSVPAGAGGVTDLMAMAPDWGGSVVKGK